MLVAAPITQQIVVQTWSYPNRHSIVGITWGSQPTEPRLGFSLRDSHRRYLLTSPRSPITPTIDMGLFSRLLKVTAAGSVASVGVFFGATRNDVFEPLDTSDPIFQSPFFQKFNPNRNPTLHDKCVRRIPLDKIEPSLLEKKGKLVEAFCAGVWGGMGEFRIVHTTSLANGAILLLRLI